MKYFAPLLLVALIASCATPRGPAESSPTTPPAAAVTAEPAPAAAPETPAAPPALPAWTQGLPPPLPPPELPPAPPPEPPPVEALLPAVVDNADLLDVVWSHRLDFAEAGVPLVTIRLMEGQGEIAFRPRGVARLALRGAPDQEFPGGVALRVRVEGAKPAAFVHQVLLAEAPAADVAQLTEARRMWEQRGVAVRSRVVGGVFGIGGRIVDNRREILFSDGDGNLDTATKLAESLRAQFGVRLGIDRRVAARPAGRLILLDAKGDRVGEADSALSVDVEGKAGFVVERVVHDLRESGREREDRSYGGRLIVTVDADGKLAAIHAVSLEELLRGLVPAEMPALSHTEALKAQAVTARSNVLAQIGVRHLEDPYMICAEVHCQAYRGEGAHHPRTDEAIRATAGEAIFSRRDQRLVDAVYHAMCGGHGENNEYVWGNTPDPALRGRPDLPEAEAAQWAGGLSDEAKLRRFLAADTGAWCRRASATRRDRWRWERRLGPGDLAEIGASLGVGSVTGLEVRGRGVSGRARYLHVEGATGSAEIAGELKIRRLLRNLPSAMAVFEREGEEWVVRGGGWGHGAGMCQWGAVGRAEAGQDYRQILRAYYSGAEVAKVY